jgi:hypothetical protein
VEILEQRLAPANAIVTENQLTGTPQSVWGVTGAGDATIQGFATDISVNHGQTINFKINDTANASYHIDIYRMGYYQGNGARLVTAIPSSQTLRQVQPTPLTNAATGLVDAGNWSASASWAVPGNAVSGLYFARPTRDDTGGATLIYFVVRADESTSDLLFQTSDSTWEAYNSWVGTTGGSGNSLYQYGGSNTTLQSEGRAYKVSYNRPLIVDATGGGLGDYNSPLHSEYPMVRWLEANGYDVSYFTDVDSDRNGALIKNHKAFLSVGHDEYWSGPQRNNVEAARNAGVNLAFLSGNECYWKTRWETSIDSSGTAYRTLVCYKESKDNAPIDPLDTSPTWTWTGTWRDNRFSPPADGGRPENSMSGTAYMNDRTNVDLGISMQVPALDANLRFWRNTSVANLQSGQTATLGQYTVGYETDEDLDNGFRPAGLMDMSSTTFTTTSHAIVPWGTVTGNGTSTDSITLYRAASGALVFGAGSIQWSWGLDGNHNDSPSSPDPAMQQATVNLLADMHALPGSLQSGLVAATASTDTTAPTSTITSPTAGASIQSGSTITITGTATDAGGGVVAGVEVSVDGGLTWHPATGHASWSYTWTPNALGSLTIKTRAVDDSSNLETPSAGVTVTVAGPMSIWPNSAAPYNPSDSDTANVEVGVKFRSDVAGYILGLRFYKGASNTGTHVGTLWTSSGTALASATFTNESASGWQKVTFASPVPINPNTTYVASYHAPNGHYAGDDYGFINSGYTSGPLHALQSGVDGPDGVFAVSTTSTFPTNTFASANYWVDVLFDTTANDTTPPTVTSKLPAPGATSVSTTTTVSAVFSEAIQPATASFVLRDSSNNVVSTSMSYNSTTDTLTLTPSAPLANSATYTATVSGAKDLAGNTMAGSVSWSFTTIAALGSGPFTIWSASSSPGTADDSDSSSSEVGVKFRSDVAGTITGIRFYKGPTNTGTHVATLWSRTGTALASATFSNETASGWQQVNFASPVSIQANTTYVASYHAPNGRYAEDDNYFTSSGVDNAPLHALQSGVDGYDGVWAYSSGSVFPTNVWQDANYWVDVVFYNNSDTQPPTAPTNLAASGAIGSVSLSWTASTDNVGVTRYNVYRSTTSPFQPSSNNLIGTSTSTSYTDFVAAGTYYYLATAQDAAGNISAPSNQSTGISQADTTPPSVSMTSPTSGTTISGTVAVAANASDNVAVASVQFVLDGTNYGSPITTAPYSLSWNSATVSNGTHTWAAVAKDTSGNTTTSANDSFTVNNSSFPGEVASYSLDEGTGTTVNDSSTNNNKGTTANTTWAAGEYGNALKFTGATNSMATISNSSSLALTTGLTLEAWVNPSTLNSPDAGWCAAVAKDHQNSNNDVAYALYAANGNGTPPALHLLIGNQDVGLQGTSVLTLNTWTFLTGTYDGTTMRLYVNGSQVSTKSKTGNITTTTDPLRLGGDWSGEMFTGLIDNVRIYNRALSASEITSDMNTPISARPLHAQDAPTGGGGQPLTQSLMDGVVDQAINRWAAAGLSAQRLEVLHEVHLEVRDLPSPYLGLTSGNQIWISRTAQGYGWFTNPGNDSAFAGGQVHGMDLLTTVVHEFGHVLNLEHDDGYSAMSEWLPPATRRDPDVPEQTIAATIGLDTTVPTGLAGGQTLDRVAAVAPAALHQPMTEPAVMPAMLPTFGPGAMPLAMPEQQTDSGGLLYQPLASLSGAAAFSMDSDSRDVLLGGSGQDVLIGARGSDLLVGGFASDPSVSDGGESKLTADAARHGDLDAVFAGLVGE